MSVLEIPASAAQQRLWAVVQENPDEVIYQLGIDIVTEGPLDLAALEASLRDLIVRHEALRTEFHLVDGVLHQRVQQPPDRAPVQLIEVSGQTEGEIDANVLRTRVRLVTTAIDLGHSPMVRVTVVRRPGGPEQGARPSDTIVVVAHHIIMDAWSAEVLIAELLAGYQAHRAGRRPQFPPVEVQCADFCAWLASQADDAQCQQDLEFWRGELADLAELDLTHGRPRPAVPSHRGGRLDAEIGPALTGTLRQFARDQRCTPFMVLYAAFCVALGRVFGGMDVAVGTNVSTRKLPETADTIGMFVDRLVLRLDVSGEQTFGDLVSRARNVVLTTHDHTAPGFEQIVSAVAPRRALGVTPLAQVSFNLQPAVSARAAELHKQILDAPSQPGTDQDFPLRPVGGGQFYGTVLHDLGLDLRVRPARFTGILEYREGIVTEADARRVLSLMRRVLQAGMTQPDRPLATIESLEPTDLARTLTVQDGGPAQKPQDHLLDMVGSWARATPQALAVDAHDGQLSYRELALHTNALAGRLRALGIAAEQPVLVAVGPGVALPVALLAVLAAGGAFAPADPQAPAGYLADAAAAAGARVAVTGPGEQPSLPASMTRVTLSPPSGETVPGETVPGAAASLAKPAGIHPASAAYVLFTSGSTGRPKGVTVEHRNLAAYLSGAAAVIGPVPGAVHLFIQNPAFDASLTTIFGALASGGVLRIPGAGTALDPGSLAEAVTAAPVDYLKLTPSHLGALLAGQDEKMLQALRPRQAVILGGEAVSPQLTGRLTAAGWNVINQYGPTETTIGVLLGSAGDVRHDDVTQPGPAWLGRPLPGVHVYVLDEHGKQVPPGRVGELCVAGDLVSRGYAAGPAATAAAFCPDPYAQIPGARMYRTGDLVRGRGDGTFAFCGRRDRQVKIRGHRVEPAAIEAVLRAQPGVAQAAVLARGEQDAQRLVGYVVLAGRSSPDSPGQAPPQEADLRAALAARLPEHAMPSALVMIASLPLTRSGKLDLAALPDPDHDEPSGTDDADAAPATGVEQRLAEIWRGVLRRDTVPVTADFFDLGGDSIRAVQAVAEARAQGIQLTMRGLMRQRTIRSLATTLPAEAGGQTGPPSAAAPGMPDWAGVTRIHVPPGADPQPRLAPYADGGSALVGLGVHAQHIELTADAARCDDYTLGALATALTDPAAPPPPLPPASPAGGGQSRPAGQAIEITGIAGLVSTPRLAHVALPAPVHDALRGPVHDAYGTELPDLTLAAVARALHVLGLPGPGRLLLTDVAAGAGTGREAGQRARAASVEFAAEADVGTLVRAAKAAVRAARDAGLAGPGSRPGSATATVRVLDLPSGATLAGAHMPPDQPVVFLAGADLLVATAAGLDAGRLGEAVRDALAEIVRHCAARAPEYSQADFPAANLSQEDLDRLLASVTTLDDDGAGR